MPKTAKDAPTTKQSKNLKHLLGRPRSEVYWTSLPGFGFVSVPKTKNLFPFVRRPARGLEPRVALSSGAIRLCRFLTRVSCA